MGAIAGVRAGLQTCKCMEAKKMQTNDARFAVLPSPGRSVAGGDRPGLRRPRPPKLYRIGEVVEYSGMSRQTIHNYTTMGLLQESRWTPGGHRLYDESVFERLDLIGDLKAQNKSLEAIRQFFSDEETA